MILFFFYQKPVADSDSTFIKDKPIQLYNEATCLVNYIILYYIILYYIIKVITFSMLYSTEHEIRPKPKEYCHVGKDLQGASSKGMYLRLFKSTAVLTRDSKILDSYLLPLQLYSLPVRGVKVPANLCGQIKLFVRVNGKQ